MRAAGVLFEQAHREESYGRVAVWQDPFGNRWDLLQRKVDLTTEDHGLQSFRPSFQPDDRFRLQAESFFRCIVNGAPPYCSLNDGLLVLRVIKEAHTKASHE